MDEVKLAKLFHQVYEDLAPSFGYETRTDTKEFDEEAKNGKLMIATCKAILPEILASQLDALVRLLHSKSNILEQEAYGYYVQNNINLMHERNDVARAIRMTANYLDGTQSA